MESKTRRCSTCRAKVPAESAFIGSLKAFCSYPCLRQYASSKTGQKAVQKAHNAEKAERKQKLKTRSDYLKEAQQAFNLYVRIRDEEKPCISCGGLHPNQKHGGVRDCGHMLSRGAHPQLRFRLDNTASQCVRCNRYLSGNVAKFREGMINRWGLERVERLEAYSEPVKMDVQYLERIKSIFSKRARMYQRLFR